MIKATRRKFLKFMGASPLVARQALADEQLMKDVGAGVLGNLHDHQGPMIGGGDDEVEKLLHTLKVFGLPEWKKQEIKEQAKYVNRLSPDIAGLRSVSISSKFRMQQSLNEKQIEQNIYDYLNRELKRNYFQKLHKIYRYF